LCITGLRRNEKPTRFMEMDLFRDVVEKIKDHACHLQLYKWGESLLHPHFNEMLAYCGRYDLNSEISTNFSLKHIDAKLEAMVQHRLKHLIVSFDGVTPEDYRRYRVGGDFHLVCENIKKLHDLKRHYRSQFPKISLQFLRNKYTGHQIEILKAEHRRLGADAYYVCDMTMPFKDHDPDQARKWFSEDEIRRRRFLDIDLSMHGKPCYFLYTTLIVEQDGSIPPCCFSTRPADDYSRWQSTLSLREMYNTPRFVQARRLFKEKSVAPDSTCDGCTVLRTYLEKAQAPFVSVIIPTYNRAGMLADTLRSLMQQTYPSDRYEIIVVDNNSSDGTPQAVAGLVKGSPVPITYLCEKRQGVHYARNSAVKHARGSILYFTDDDMLADSMALAELVRSFTVDVRVASATGRVLPRWEAPPPEWILKFCRNGWLSLNDQGEGWFASDEDPGVYSCHMAVRRDVFLQSGGFNPENTAGEWIGDGETGLNLKIRALGYRFAYNGRSIVYHMIPSVRMTQDYLNRRFANQGNCDSYTDFRRDRFSETQLRQQVIQHLSKLAAHAERCAQRRSEGDDRWRVEQAYTHYYHSRIEYDFKLIQDESWRCLVLRDNWLEERGHGARC
jgi:glycosyltransferase involved in cell wall biosynthesis